LETPNYLFLDLGVEVLLFGLLHQEESLIVFLSELGSASRGLHSALLLGDLGGLFSDFSCLSQTSVLCHVGLYKI